MVAVALKDVLRPTDAGVEHVFNADTGSANRNPAEFRLGHGGHFATKGFRKHLCAEADSKNRDLSGVRLAHEF